MKIGIFGGTFDPIHNGHIFAIKYALENQQLDQLRVFVAGNPYQKEPPAVDAKQRLEWVESAIAEEFGPEERIIIDDREIHRKGNTYTIDTVRELQAEFKGAKLFLIVGHDILESISSWKDSDELLSKVEPLIVPRNPSDVSSSLIRSLLIEKKPLTGLLPAKIEREIIENSLYN